MIQFARRRVFGWTILIVIAGLLAAVSHAMHTALLSAQAGLGWLLLGLILVLAAYRLRKQLPMLPLGTSAGWLQIHVYTGLLTLPVFLLHTGLKLPRGIIEAPLGVLFVVVFSSGVVGLLLTRLIPPRLTSRGEEVLFDRTPTVIRQLRENAEACAIGNSDNSSDVIGELYISHLHSFFQRPANFWQHVLHSAAPRRALLKHLEDSRRFLNSEQHATIERLADLVERKDDLDYQHALKSLLKYWLFVHVPLTGALLVFSLFHLIVTRSY